MVLQTPVRAVISTFKTEWNWISKLTMKRCCHFDDESTSMATATVTLVSHWIIRHIFPQTIHSSLTWWTDKSDSCITKRSGSECINSRLRMNQLQGESLTVQCPPAPPDCMQKVWSLLPEADFTVALYAAARGEIEGSCFGLYNRWTFIHCWVHHEAETRRGWPWQVKVQSVSCSCPQPLIPNKRFVSVNFNPLPSLVHAPSPQGVPHPSEPIPLKTVFFFFAALLFCFRQTTSCWTNFNDHFFLSDVVVIVHHQFWASVDATWPDISLDSVTINTIQMVL